MKHEHDYEHECEGYYSCLDVYNTFNSTIDTQFMTLITIYKTGCLYYAKQKSFPNLKVYSE